jgi:hypothetical protein
VAAAGTPTGYSGRDNRVPHTLCLVSSCFLVGLVPRARVYIESPPKSQALLVRVTRERPRRFGVRRDHDQLVSSTREVSAISQQGQLFRLKRTRREGEPLWAYRYRMGGRGPTTHTSRRTKMEDGKPPQRLPPGERRLAPCISSGLRAGTLASDREPVKGVERGDYGHAEDG